MAYQNFKPTVWSKYIQLGTEKKCRLVDDCWKQFEGDAQAGAEVKILGIGKPTISDYYGTSIGDPEVVPDSSVYLKLDQAKYFNFMIDDIDRAQSVPGVMEALLDEAIALMARERDSYVASLAEEAGLMSASLQIDSPEDAKAAIDAAILALRENDVDVDSEVSITLSPFVYNLFRSSLIGLDTNNTDLISRGIVGMYDNCIVRVSNNLYNDDTDDYMMVRTKRAIAFAGGIDKVEAYRPQDLFSDAMKGLNVFGAKVVRPNELYVIKAHK